MTSAENSKFFVLGLALLHQLKNEEYSISVVETSGIVVQGLNNISKEILEDLRLFGWEAGNKDGTGWAQFFKLEYEDY